MGTRGSRLALIQSRLVADRIRALGIKVEIVTIVSDGDLRAPDAPIGEGIFVTALERALASREIDVAVHSAKDLPLDEDPLTTIIAYTERADPLDVLVTPEAGKRLKDVAKGSRVGTDSPRRAGFLRALRPDLEVMPIHGNVDTRLQRLDSGSADALVLAAAGLLRLGFAARAVTVLAPDEMPPAPGQGALAVQIRHDDSEIASLLAPLDRAEVREPVVAERALLKAMGGGCRAPVGALAKREGDRFTFVAGAVTPDGRSRHIVQRDIAGDPRALAQAAIAIAAELNQHVHLRARAVLDTRPDLDSEFAAAAGDLGFRHVHVPAIAIKESRDPGLQHQREHLGDWDWVVLTSKRGVEALLPEPIMPPAGVRWAAVGASTARALERRGVKADCVPAEANADALPDAMAALGSLRGARILLARADAATPSLPERLRELGAQVEDVAAYSTSVGPRDSRAAVADALADPELEAVIFASGSAVRGLLELAGDEAQRIRSLKTITIGPRTSAALREAGFEVTRESRTRDSQGLASALKAALDDEVERWVESQLRLPV